MPSPISQMCEMGLFLLNIAIGMDAYGYRDNGSK